MNTSRFTTAASMFVVALTTLLAAAPSACQAQEFRGISIALNSIRISDEDDPLSDDEPYLIFIRVKARVVGAAGARRLDGSSIAVSLAMNGHNNLGRSGDNWADEVRTYNIPTTVPHVVQDIVPDEQGWFVAGLLLHMEEDAFSDRTAREFGENTRSALERELRRFTAPGTRLETDAMLREILGGLVMSVSRDSFTRALVSGVDPDDVGGLQIAMGFTLGRGVVATFAGDPSALGDFLSGGPLPPGVQLLSGASATRNISLAYPGGLRGDFPGSARFKGKHTVNATIQTWNQRF